MERTRAERRAGTPLVAHGVRFGAASRRLADEQRGGGAQQPWNRRDVERVAPAPVLQNPSARAVGESEADRQTEHPDGHGTSTQIRREEIAEQRRGRRRARRFSNADAEAGDDELREVAREAGRGGQQAPDEYAAGQDEAARARVREPAERQAKDGVEQREHGAEEAQRRVAQPPLAADALSDAADELAVEEVHEVDREEHDQRVDGAGRGAAHRCILGGSEWEPLGRNHRVGDTPPGGNCIDAGIRREALCVPDEIDEIDRSSAAPSRPASAATTCLVA